jgi:hypothetical protein
MRRGITLLSLSVAEAHSKPGGRTRTRVSALHGLLLVAFDRYLAGCGAKAIGSALVGVAMALGGWATTSVTIAF